MITITYEDNKCACCEKVYVNSFLMDLHDAESKKFIICPDCAEAIYKFMKDVKDAGT